MKKTYEMFPSGMHDKLTGDVDQKYAFADHQTRELGGREQIPMRDLGRKLKGYEFLPVLTSGVAESSRSLATDWEMPPLWSDYWNPPGSSSK